MTFSEEHSIDHVFGLLVRMFDLVDELVSNATNALVTADSELAKQVATMDKEVDVLELEVDRTCEFLLATTAPDLVQIRKLIAAMRINGELERVGDLSKNIAKKTGLVPPVSVWSAETNLIDLADAVRRIIRDTRDALASHDRLRARQVTAFDLQVDRAWREVHPAVSALCAQYPEHTGGLIHIVIVGKSLERMADHAKSIARSIIYAVEGVDSRHQNAHAVLEADAASTHANILHADRS